MEQTKNGSFALTKHIRAIQNNAGNKWQIV